MGKIKLSALSFFFVALFSFTLQGKVTVKKSDYRGRQAYTLENKYVRVVIVPEIDGRIVEYTYKAKGYNYFNPYREKKTAKVPLLEQSGAMIIQHNFGGFHDMFWGCLKLNRTKYNAKIIKNTPERVSVLLSPTDNGDLSISRKISLDEKTTVLKIVSEIVNKTDAAFHYWPQMGVSIGNDLSWEKKDDLLVVPIRNYSKGESIPPGILRRLKQTGLPTENKLLVKEIGRGYLSYLLAQPWWAIGDTQKNIAVGQILSPASLGNEISVARLGSFMAWDPDGNYSSQCEHMIQEIIFPAVEPGKKRIFSISLASVDGFAVPNYMDGNIAVKLQFSKNKKAAKIAIVPLHEIDKNYVSVFLQTNKNKKPVLLKKIALEKLVPGKIYEEKLLLPAGWQDSFSLYVSSDFSQKEYNSRIKIYVR